MGEKEHDKEERPKTLESDLEIEKGNDSSLASVVPNPIVTYKPGFLALKLWMHHFFLRKTSK